MKRTPWYPASVNPVRDGLYEWRCKSFFAREGIKLRSWTHGGWDDLNPCPKCQWRGLAQPSEQCKCDLRTRLVGDGCQFCNPKLAAELANERREG